MSEPGPPLEVREPGWYRDPANARLHRFWNGQRWVSQDELFPPRSEDGSDAR